MAAREAQVFHSGVPVNTSLRPAVSAVLQWTPDWLGRRGFITFIRPVWGERDENGENAGNPQTSETRLPREHF